MCLQDNVIRRKSYEDVTTRAFLYKSIGFRTSASAYEIAVKLLPSCEKCVHETDKKQKLFNGCFNINI